jgi:hypothetical protein
MGYPHGHGLGGPYLGLHVPEVCSLWDIHLLYHSPLFTRSYTRQSVPDTSVKMDIYSHGYAGYILLYIFCGFLDAMWQTTAYWIMGAMSNDPAKLAHFAGFYKSMQSAGAAGIWRADAVKMP